MKQTNQRLIKASNMKSLFLLVQKEHTSSRAALAKATQLSKATVSSLIDELIANGYILDCGVGSSPTTGRKPNTLTVNSQQNYVVVFQWHKTCLNAALISINGTIVYEVRDSVVSPSDYLQKMARILHDDMAHHCPNSRILGVCIVVPAIVDGYSKRIVSTALSSSLEQYHLEELQSLIPDYPILVLNDTSCYAYAECVHSAMENVYYAFVNIGTGVGAVMLDHGHFFRAANGMTTQFGHFSVDRRGEKCNCGNRGCLERRIGELYLYQRALKEGCGELFANEEAASFDQLAEMVYAGEPSALKLLHSLAQDTAYALSNLISLCNPQEIVIGGNGMVLGEPFMDHLRNEISHMGFTLFMENVKIRFSKLNKSSAISGAASYYIDHYFTFDEDMARELYIG